MTAEMPRRKLLKQLDVCLGLLEDAHERGESCVTRQVVGTCAPVLEGLMAGMPIVDAIELVFAHQERLMLITQGEECGDQIASSAPGLFGPDVGSPVALSPEPSDGPADLLTRPAARRLTEQIRANLRQASVLLLAAYRGNAWSALGYPTWEQYVHAELGISRSRSYELLEHGRVLRAIQLAGGLSGLPGISAFAAHEIKGRVPLVAHEVTDQCRGLTEKAKQQVVASIVRQHRVSRDAKSRDPEVHLPSADQRVKLDALSTFDGGQGDVSKLIAAVEYLCSLPAPEVVVAGLPDDVSDRLNGFDRALQWMTGFAGEWSRQRAGTERLPSRMLQMKSALVPQITVDNDDANGIGRLLDETSARSLHYAAAAATA